MLKSNPDLTTIGNIVVSVAALAAMTALLITKSIDLTVAGYFLAFVAALNGFTGALKAPSPQQASDLVTALAASGPINPGPLVQITHPTTSAPDIQVSSAALPPIQQQGPQPIILPQVTNTPTPMNNQPAPQGILTFPSNSTTGTSWPDQQAQPQQQPQQQ
jgi:hypothetical protein